MKLTQLYKISDIVYSRHCLNGWVKSLKKNTDLIDYDHFYKQKIKTI
jgi:hypothetical protein